MHAYNVMLQNQFVRLMIGLDDLGGIFQPQGFCDSILFITVLISLGDFVNLLDMVKL